MVPPRTVMRPIRGLKAQQLSAALSKLYMPAIGHYCVIYSKQPQIPLVVDGDIHDHATDQRPDENGSPLSADEPGKTNVMSDQKQMGKGRAAAIRAGMGPWFRREIGRAHV